MYGKPCIYKIETHDFAQDISSHVVKTCIVFNDGQYDSYLFSYENNVLGDGDLGEYKLARCFNL